MPCPLLRSVLRCCKTLRSYRLKLEPTGERYVLAARISGPATTAFADGIEGREKGLQSAENINVIVVADTDMLSDRMWVQVQDFLVNAYRNHGHRTAALRLMLWIICPARMH